MNLNENILNGIINEELENIAKYNKFPLNALVKQAKNFSDFKRFSNFYSLEIYHGYYWHLTENPNFKISDEIAPRDMSSMSTGTGHNKGAIMVTSDLEYWDEHYNTNYKTQKKEIKRNYVALFDASNVDPKHLQQVSRGFGNEVYLNPNEAKQLKQIGVYNLKYAKALDKKFHNIIPGTEEELYKIWKYANANLNENILKDIVIDELNALNEATYKVYHGTNQEFKNFDLSKATQGIIWFTDSIDSIKKGEHGGQGSKYIMTRYITLNNPAGWPEYDKYSLGQIKQMGYDGIILPHGTEYNDFIVFNKKSIRIKGKEDVIINEEIDNQEMNNIREYLINYFDLNNIVEPSTIPIKNGYVRLFHQTDKNNFDEIKRDGAIKISRSRGKINNEPISIWGHETGYYGSPKERYSIEYQVPENEINGGRVNRDITSNDIIAFHNPILFKIKDMILNDDYLSTISDNIAFYLTFEHNDPIYLIANAISNKKTNINEIIKEEVNNSHNIDDKVNENLNLNKYYPNIDLNTEDVFDMIDYHDSYLNLYPGYDENDNEYGEDYYFKSKEDAYNDINDTLNFFNEMSNPIPIYRTIKVNSLDDVNYSYLGDSWSFDKESAINFARNQAGGNVLLSAKTSFDNVDWKKTLDVYYLFSNNNFSGDAENEITINDSDNLIDVNAEYTNQSNNLYEQIINELESINEEDYRGSHTAPNKEYGAPMHDLTDIYPNDIYDRNAARLYGHLVPYDQLAINIIQQARNKPNQKVTIYRAVPNVITNQEKIDDFEKQKSYILKYGKLPPKITNWENRSEYYEFLSQKIEQLKALPPTPNEKIKINNGDWVAIAPQYAKEHGENQFDVGNYRILKKTVNAKDLYTDGNSIHEWGYGP